MRLLSHRTSPPPRPFLTWQLSSAAALLAQLEADKEAAEKRELREAYVATSADYAQPIRARAEPISSRPAGLTNAQRQRRQNKHGLKRLEPKTDAAQRSWMNNPRFDEYERPADEPVDELPTICGSSNLLALQRRGKRS